MFSLPYFYFTLCCSYRDDHFSELFQLVIFFWIAFSIYQVCNQPICRLAWANIGEKNFPHVARSQLSHSKGFPETELSHLDSDDRLCIH